MTQIAWSDVKRVSYRKTWSRFEIDGADKQIRISNSVGDLKVLAKECRRRLPREVYKGAFKHLKELPLQQ